MTARGRGGERDVNCRIRVLVKPVGDVVLQDMVQVIDALAAAGVTEMSLVSGPDRRVSRRAL